MPQMDQSPQDFPQDGLDDMNNEMEPMDENPFDSNFDAGVEADEESDPKKYIQQLTGKLSQSLRDYNETNGEPDNDLNKYVAGMIIPQATDSLDGEGKKEIIQKINDGSNNSDDSSNDFSNNMNDGLSDEELPPTDNMPMEGKKRVNYTNKQFKRITENLGDMDRMLDRNANKERVEKNVSKSITKGVKSKPYESPKFK